MSMSTLQRDAAIVAQAARRISSAVDYDALIERAGEAQLVLIGEASHGTHEFYATRAELTKRLIDEKRLPRRGAGSGLAGQLSRASLRDWPERGRERGQDAERFSGRIVVGNLGQWERKGEGERRG
jgi:hypothetical protein